MSWIYIYTRRIQNLKNNDDNNIDKATEVINREERGEDERGEDGGGVEG